MPIIRKVIQVGTSKAISLPKSWLKFYESRTGTKIRGVAIQVNRVLIIEPVLSQSCIEAIEVTESVGMGVDA